MLHSGSHKTIYIGIDKIPVLICRNLKSRRINITVKIDGSVKVSYPKILSTSYINDLVQSKASWIEEKVRYFSGKNPVLLTKHTRAEFNKYKKDALILVREKLEYFNNYYNLEYKNVCIKNQKTRWGSCSSGKNLSFNYKIIFLPPDLQDYLIVHELCHLKEMNHAKKFWDLVGERIIDYKVLSKSLRIGDFK